jgi:5-methylcytosine-specific restriction endonuclease McrBC GTP-binding regulatory subunit McrB
LFYRKLKVIPNFRVSYGVSENNPPPKHWKISENEMNLARVEYYSADFLRILEKKIPT